MINGSVVKINIRPPPDNLNQLCRKRLKLGANQPNRALDFEEDVCFEACLSSKCYQAKEVPNNMG
eukprot:scaffold15312_cov126-Skeletonema_menzelii.AAC.2